MNIFIPVPQDKLNQLIRMAGNSIPNTMIVNAVNEKTIIRQFKVAQTRTNNQFSDLFRKVQDKVINKIIDTYDLNEHERSLLLEEFETLRTPMTGILKKGLSDAITIGNREATLSIQKLGSDITYKDFNPKVRELLLERADKAVEQSLNTMSEQLMDRVATAYEKGWNSEKAAREISATMDGMENKNLKTLTRTEMHSAKMEARQLKYQEMGVEHTIWLTSQDDLVRGNDPKDEADHTILEGEITPIGEPFSNGLLYPGDMNGPIEEWINCRCDYRPFIMPLGKEAPGEGPFHEEDLVDVENTVSVQDVKDITP